MARIVVSYRRLDSAAIAGRIFDRLAQRYGKESVFMDIDNIPAGVDFRERIGEALHASDALVVVVGPKWLDPKKRGHTTIYDETDWVRLEVETALQQKIPLIPALVGGAAMPKADKLPPSLRDFAFRNATTIDAGLDFNTHIERLLRSLDLLLAPTAAQASPPTPEPEDASSRPARKAGHAWGLGAAGLTAALVGVALVVLMRGDGDPLEKLFPTSGEKKQMEPEPVWVSRPPPSAVQVANVPSNQKAVLQTASSPAGQSMALSAAEIAAKFAPMTVQVSASWSLRDEASNARIYQKALRQGGRNLPAYVRLPDNRIVHWLTTDDGGGANIPIASSEQATGFVIGDQGEILTDIRVAAGWMAPYPPASGSAVLVASGSAVSGAAVFNPSQAPDAADIRAWTPWQSGAPIFANDKPTVIATGNFAGVYDFLEAAFPGSALVLNAKLLNTSRSASIAAIKIESPQPLTAVTLSNDTPRIGARIVALGYPRVSQMTAAHFGDRPQARRPVVPDPSAIDGIVSRLGTVVRPGQLPDAFLLSVASRLDPGSPVFNSEGAVVGMVSDDPLTGPYVVPAKYGKALLSPATPASPATSPSAKDAIAAYMAKDFARAASLAEGFAKQGDAESQFIMGRLYETGQSVPADASVAADWYAKAAEQGLVKAQYNLGVLYSIGNGVVRDTRMAAEWFQKAARQGHTLAQLSLGSMYEKGDGVERDTEEAERWYTEALKSNDPVLVKDARDALDRLNRGPRRR